MSFDPTLVRRGIRHLSAVDPILGSHIRRLGPFRLQAERRRFVALARSIVAQQISGKAAKSIWKLLPKAGALSSTICGPLKVRLPLFPASASPT